jgi:hypothetical protein
MGGFLVRSSCLVVYSLGLLCFGPVAVSQKCRVHPR